MSKIDLIIDALSVARNSVWSALNQEALAYAIELKLELAKPEQEPAAWMYKGNFHDFDPSEWASPEFVVTPLYTAPPRKEWVGLTDHDIEFTFLISGFTAKNFAHAIEAKLRQKNT